MADSFSSEENRPHRMRCYDSESENDSQRDDRGISEQEHPVRRKNPKDTMSTSQKQVSEGKAHVTKEKENELEPESLEKRPDRNEDRPTGGSSLEETERKVKLHSAKNLFSRLQKKRKDVK